MPIDRRRRNELADIFAKFLRDEVEGRDFAVAAGGILRQPPQISRKARTQEGPGFPLAPISGDEPLDDLVLDFQIASAIDKSLALSYSNQRNRKTGEARAILIRALCLLRSNLDERDLILPRNPTIARHPLLKLGCLSSATFLAALFALAFLNTPYPLLLWPLMGLVLGLKRGFLVRNSEVRDEAGAFPFRTCAQWEAAAPLVPPDELKKFVQTFDELKSALEKPRSRWKWAWLIPISVLLLPVGALLTVGVVAFIAALYLAIWPFFLYDKVRIARKAQWR